MNQALKYSTLAVFIGSSVGIAHADLAETKGGITVKTDDGRFEAKIGGRVHWDSNIPLDDDADNIEQGVGEQRTDAFFRRARLTIDGKAYGWNWKFENDFAGQTDSVSCAAQTITVPEPTGTATSVTVTKPAQTCEGNAGRGFREVWIGTQVFGANLRLGQAKPYRGMEEITSSNEILFMERPFASASGIYRQFQEGIFLDRAGKNWGWGVSVYDLRDAAGAETDGIGSSARVYFAPMMSDTSVLHLGLSGGIDNPANNFTVAPSSLRYSGRSGPTASLGASTVKEQTTYALELAGKAGPVYGQAEYAMATFSEDVNDDEEVNTYYVQVSYLLTGETKPYDIKKGVFKSPKPKNASGAWEAKVRYDFAESKEVTVETEVTQLAVGLNWFINPNVRMMFEYLSGEAEPANADTRKLDVLATRLQLSF